MVIIMMLPFQNPFELARFRQLSKTCKKLMLKVNLIVLFGAQGIQFTSDEVLEIKFSTSRALEVAAAKYKMLNSISYSQQIIGERALDQRPTTVCFFDAEKLQNYSL